MKTLQTLRRNLFKPWFFQKLGDGGFSSICPGRDKVDPKVTDIKALRYTPIDDVFFKLRFTEELLTQRKSPGVTAFPFDALRNQQLAMRKITERKFDDLQYLIFTKYRTLRLP